MSLESTVWVLRNSPSKLADRLVLWAIADETDKDGVNLFGIGYDRVAAHANVDKRTAIRCVANLEAAGELLVKRKGGRGNSNLYVLTMGANPLELADRYGWEHPPIDPAKAPAQTVTDCHRYLEAQRVALVRETVTPATAKGDTAPPDPQRPVDNPRGRVPEIVDNPPARPWEGAGEHLAAIRRGLHPLGEPEERTA